MKDTSLNLLYNPVVNLKILKSIKNQTFLNDASSPIAIEEISHQWFQIWGQIVERVKLSIFNVGYLSLNRVMVAL